MEEMKQATDIITQSSMEIQAIIKSINNIAEQTNILSLNAAIEAARAGKPAKALPLPPRKCANWRHKVPRL